METTIVLTSGGIDSWVLASIEAQNHALALLHIDYHHQARAMERASFDRMVRHYQAKFSLVVELDHFKQMGGCSLVDPRFAVESAELIGSQWPRSYLPFGFPTFWSVAASWAQTIRAAKIVCGGSEDYGLKLPAYGKIEPAMDREAVHLFNYLLQKVTPPGQQVALELPFLRMKRPEILLAGSQLNTPFEHAWSCYQGGPSACQECYRCRVRQESFQRTRLADPRKR